MNNKIYMNYTTVVNHQLPYCYETKATKTGLTMCNNINCSIRDKCGFTKPMKIIRSKGFEK